MTACTGEPWKQATTSRRAVAQTAVALPVHGTACVACAGDVYTSAAAEGCVRHRALPQQVREPSKCLHQPRPHGPHWRHPLSRGDAVRYDAHQARMHTSVLNEGTPQLHMRSSMQQQDGLPGMPELHSFAAALPPVLKMHTSTSGRSSAPHMRTTAPSLRGRHSQWPYAARSWACPPPRCTAYRACARRRAHSSPSTPTSRTSPSPLRRRQ